MVREAGSRSKKAAARARRRRAAEMRAAMLTILLIVCMTCLVLFIKGQKLKAQIKENERIADSLTAQIEEEEARTAEIEALKDYYESDEFIRQAARDRLGLIEEGQIVFRRAD